MLETLMLSRIQFAANISFHILFPTITIALSWFLFYFKLRFDQTADPVWMRAYRFWVKIFAITFAIGVVSGITMSFQFGTNWPKFMETVGNIAGPLLGYEVLTAFFLEAGFLGIMLFGINKVSARVHTLSTLIVAIGTSLSAFWILALNSWMQTPQGHEMRDGVAFPVDWLAIIFNPSFPYRLMHMLIASGLTAALTVAALLTPLQVFVGDLHGLNTLEHQPQKIAAMEGVWHTEKGAPLLLFALPDETKKTNYFEVAIPNMASLILTHDLNGEIKGLNEFENDHPPVAPVFFAFRLMVGLGMLMLAIAWFGRFTLWRKKQLTPWLLNALVAMSFSGWLATLAGWYVTEIGRQPWLVTGVLTIKDAATDIAPENVGLTLIMYLILYVVILIAYLHTVFTMASRAVEIEEISDDEKVKPVVHSHKLVKE